MAGYCPIHNRYYTLWFSSTGGGNFQCVFSRDADTAASQYTGKATVEFGFDGNDTTNADIFMQTVGDAIADAFTNASSNSFGTVTFVKATGPFTDAQLVP